MKKSSPKNKVSPAAARRERFAHEYVIDHNATRAYKAAGYKAKTDNVAAASALKLLRNTQVAKIVAEFDKKTNEAAGLTAELVKRSLANALLFDPRKLYREDGTLKNVTELDPDTADALAGLEVTEVGSKIVVVTKKLKWLDKNSAREQAMKHFGLYEKDNKPVADAIAGLMAAVKEHGQRIPIKA